MEKVYRIEVTTVWVHPELKFGKFRSQVYDFTSGKLVVDERCWFNGQDFYDPIRSPHIYADKETADAIYDELDYSMDDWEPLSDIITDDSGERLAAYSLVSVDENGNEHIEAECDVLELLAVLNETAKELAVA